MSRKTQIAFVTFVYLTLGTGDATAQTIEDAQLWYTELTIAVCNVESAGTDSRIAASLGGEPMFLNLGVDDFKRSRTYSYSLQTPGVRRVRDIDELLITNRGKDALCIDTIRLSINHPTGALRDDFTIFLRSFRTERWISERPGDSANLRVGRRELRASRLWNLNPPRSGIADLQATISRNPLSRDVVERIIESFVGDALVGEKKLGWGDRKGDRYVELSPTRTRNVARIDLDLGKKGKNRRRAAVDVDFSLEVSCDDSAGNLDISVSNFNVRTKGFGGGRVWEKKIGKKLGKFGASLSQSIAIGDGSLCSFVNPRFAANGDLSLLGIAR